jgi:hypothetical protein
MAPNTPPSKKSTLFARGQSIIDKNIYPPGLVWETNAISDSKCTADEVELYLKHAVEIIAKEEKKKADSEYFQLN